ncbi:endo-1,4-B-xylanase A [Mycena olivaceomarginata]|nr:endo-1,4-B-xylanase A [Mycena olivaceomarginata]
MARFSAFFVSFLSLLPFAIAQSQEWGQCGGMGWTGPTGAASTGTTTVTTTATTTATGSGSTSTAMLNTIAKANANKLYFGSATDNSELSDTAYVAILKNNAEFGQITPGNSMKWDATEPSNGVFSFTNGDQIASFAKANGQLLRGHNLAWYQQLPSWVNSVPTAQVGSVLTTHVTTVVKHYAGQVYAWDVVNDDGSWRSFVFFNALGQNYVSMALTAARAADPAAKLYINDYNIETAGAKATAMLNLVKALQAAKVPIDGIGMESHLIVGEVPAASAFISNFEQFTALGIEVAVTELDIRMTLPATAGPARSTGEAHELEAHKTDYQNVVAACKAVAKCVGVTYSWVPSTFSGQGEACPWDANLVRKPAYDGIAAGFTN